MYANIEKASNIQKNLKNNQNNSFNRSNSYNMLSFRDGSILADKNKSKEIVEDIVNKLNTKSKDISNLRIARNKLNYSSNNLDNLNSKEKNNFLSNIHNYNDIFEKSLTSHNNTTKNIHLKSNHRNYSNNKSAIINNNYNISSPMYSKNNISKNTFLTNNAIFDGSRYDTKIEEETFCKLFIGKESENLVKNNELEMQVFETDKMSIYESSKNIIKLDINKTKENILDKKNIINIEKNDDYDNRNSNNINKIIVQGTFSLYHEGQAVFVSTDDVIFKMPIPIVGNKLNKGQKYEFKFNRKNTVSDKMNNINKIVSKYLIS